MSEKRELTRRSFLQMVSAGSAGLAGVGVMGLPGFNKLFAKAVAEVPVVWLQGGSCSGCIVSLANSLSPTVQDVLLGEVLPDKHVSLAFQPTLMAGQGQIAMDVIEKYKKADPGSFVLVIEGSLQTGDDGIFCVVGHDEKNNREVPLIDHVRELAPKAMAVVNIGTCSSFGGIPMADPNPTGAVPVGQFLKDEGIKTPYVNVPGCPPHPDWFVGTLATVLLGGLQMLKVDEHGRPLAFYGRLIHDNCQFRGQFDKGNFAQQLGDKACLYKMGCKGPITHADCPHRKWNSGVNWCIGSGSPCIGCVEPDFPFKTTMYNRVHIHETSAPDQYPPIVSEEGKGLGLGVTGALGVAVGAAAGAALASRKKTAKEGGSDES